MCYRRSSSKSRLVRDTSNIDNIDIIDTDTRQSLPAWLALNSKLAWYQRIVVATGLVYALSRVRSSVRPFNSLTLRRHRHRTPIYLCSMATAAAATIILASIVLCRHRCYLLLCCLFCCLSR